MGNMWENKTEKKWDISISNFCSWKEFPGNWTHLFLLVQLINVAVG